MSQHDHKTLNSVPKKSKHPVIDILNGRLAEAIDLALATKQAHWNLKGPTFIAVHELLDEFREGLDEHVDTIAERAVQLGGTALGTVQAVEKESKLDPYPKGIYEVQEHLKALIERYGAAAKAGRQAILGCDELEDPDSADIFTAYSRFLDKSLWFLEAHLQEKH